MTAAPTGQIVDGCTRCMTYDDNGRPAACACTHLFADSNE